MDRTRIRALTAVVAAFMATLGLAAPASGSLVPREASFEGTELSEFDQTNALSGSLTNVTTRAYEGSRSAHATYAGASTNGYSRGIWNVGWRDGDDVWYGAAYYLPEGFKDRMQGQVDLVRWDNWASMPVQAEKGGIVIYGSDKRARLVRIKQGVHQEELTDAFELPEGRWFRVDVHQRLSSSDPVSEVYLDGKLIDSSTAPNSYGHAVDRIRYGIVATSGATQTNPLELWFDQASVSDRAPVPKGASLIDFETGSCADSFSGSSSCSAWQGSFGESVETAYSGARSAKATYQGGGSGHARGQRAVDWAPGSEVEYGGSFFLPEGFRQAVEGSASLIRWDNYGSMPTNTERGGVTLSGPGGLARLVRRKDGIEEVPITSPFELPEGRWFRLEVRQRLSASDPMSEVFLDGERVAVSTEKNSYGNAVNRLRFGLENVSGQAQPLTLHVDAVSHR